MKLTSKTNSNKSIVKGCMCSDNKHKKSWHCLARKAGQNYVADFPFIRPSTHDTGLWSRNDIHRIKNWGKKH